LLKVSVVVCLVEWAGYTAGRKRKARCISMKRKKMRHAKLNGTHKYSKRKKLSLY
jgi:hypothetical protein